MKACLMLVGVFSIYYELDAVESSLNDRFTRALSINTSSSGDSLSSLLSPHKFSPENVLTQLKRDIQAYQTQKKCGLPVDLAKYKLETDLAAAEKRYAPGNSICDELKKEYADNEFLYHNGKHVVKVEDIVPLYFSQFAGEEDYQGTLLNSRKPGLLYKMYLNVAKDTSIPADKKRSFEGAFKILISEQEAQNYSLYLIACTFDDLRFNEYHHEQLTKLKNQFRKDI